MKRVKMTVLWPKHMVTMWKLAQDEQQTKYPRTGITYLGRRSQVLE